MNRRSMGIRLVAGLIVVGGLGAGSIGSTLAAPGSLDGEGLTITARFEKCTEGSPDNCKQIKPEEPSKRGGKPERERPPRGGTIQDPPEPPPTGGRIRKDSPPKERSEPVVSRTITSTGGTSEPFTAKHLEIPVVNSTKAPVAAKPVAQPAAKPMAPVAQPVAQPVAAPVVVAAPSTGTGSVAGESVGLPALLAAFAAMFGAGAVYGAIRPELSRVRK